MLQHLSKFSTKENCFNILFALIPLSFIIGNTILNLNIALFIGSAIFFYGRNIIKLDLHFIDKIILLFFAFTLFTGILNNFSTLKLDGSSEDYTIILKTIAYLRYLILYFIIRYLIENKLIDFKFFFISSFFFSFLVSLDIFYQYTLGEDIFGHKNIGNKFSGPFGDELIAGSYLQRFSFFSFFLFPIFFKIKKKNILYFIIPILFVIFFSAIIISGNRMPLILFLFVMVLVIFFEKKTRKYFILFFATASLLFIIIYNYNSTIKNNFNTFYSEISKISKIFISGRVDYNKTPAYYHEFESFYDTWLMNKYAGGGIKSFRFNCPKRKNVDKNLGERTTCNTHPHNYYLEILADLGLIGFSILSLIFLLVIYLSIIKKYFIDTSLRYNHLITPFMFLFLAEIFPIRSSGSFFTTGNSTFIFLLMAITVALARSKNLD